MPVMAEACRVLRLHGIQSFLHYISGNNWCVLSSPFKFSFVASSSGSCGTQPLCFINADQLHNILETAFQRYKEDNVQQGEELYAKWVQLQAGYEAAGVKVEGAYFLWLILFAYDQQCKELHLPAITLP